MDEEYYIINRMYAGDFISGNNIGHEVINLFSDDNGDNYIYVNQTGTIGRKYENKVKAVLLVRKADSIHRLEILGVALLGKDSQISRSLPEYHGNEKTVREKEIVSKYLESHDISYGGVNIEDIFKKNIWKGGYDDYLSITFKADKLLLPKEKIYLTDSMYTGPKERCNLSDSVIPNISLKRYIGDKENKKSFDAITTLINDKNNWDLNRKAEKIIINNKKAYVDDNYNYLDIIGRQDDENVFSNLVDYFLGNDKSLLCSFCRDVLHISDFSYNGSVEREKNVNNGRVDLWIEDDNNIVVIENKIKAEINGVNERHNFSGELVQSQLEKYYNYAEKHKGLKNTKYFILLPNYRKIDIKQYRHSEKYEKITYKQLYEFFKNNSPINNGDSGYYADFVKALHRHSEDYYDDKYAEMKKRFIRRLEFELND